MSEIPVHLLYSFVAVANAKNLNEAADRLGITQPALSKQMQQLERALPFSPFRLSGRRKVLTAYGEELYRRLKNNLGRIQNEIQSVHQHFATPENVTLKIGARREVLARFAERLAFAGNLLFVDGDRQQLPALIKSQALDLAIMNEPPPSIDLIAKPLFSDRFCVVVPRRLAPEPETLNSQVFNQLFRQPFLAYRQESPGLANIREAYKIEKPLHRHREMEDWQVLLTMVERDLGWTVAPSSMVKTGRGYWSKEIPGRVLGPTTFYLLYQKDLVQIPWFKSLIQDFLAIGRELSAH